MTNDRMIGPDNSALLIIDIQEAFRKSISSLEALAMKAAAVARGFELLDRPVIITEQYPKGLGKTLEEIASVLDKAEYFEKTGFSACMADGFVQRLRELGVSTVAVAGIETHVCVNQTVHGLLDAGFAVHLIEDAVASRHESDRSTALRKMEASGAIPSTVEMALFELLQDSASPEFKAVQSLIK